MQVLEQCPSLSVTGTKVSSSQALGWDSVTHWAADYGGDSPGQHPAPPGTEASPSPQSASQELLSEAV